jgi:antitoxin ParD1/3/4
MKRLANGRYSVNLEPMPTVPISLNEEDRRFIEEIMKSGRYFSESEVVAEALSEFRVRETIRREKMTELRAKVQSGIAQADNGEFVEFTAADVMADGRRRLEDPQAGH